MDMYKTVAKLHKQDNKEGKKRIMKSLKKSTVFRLILSDY